MGLRNLTPKVEQPTTSTMSTALTKTPQQEEQEKLNRQKQLGEQAAAGGGAKGSAMLGGKSSAEPQQKTSSQPQKAGTGSFTNLKSYLQAAQGGGQRRLAEAASGQVERLGTGAKKSVETARDVFGRNLQTGSGAVFQGIEGQTLAEQEEAATRRAQEQTQGAISTATNTTYQAPPEGESIQYFTPEQEQQFSNVINASYAGPASLQQIGEYGEAARRSAAAQQAAQQTQSAAGRAQLLRDVYGRNRDYGRGASRLDAMLLNASEQGVQQLQQQAQPALQAREALQAAENISANEAAQRAGSIEKIRTGAMTDFTEARAAEEAAVNERLAQVVENWNRLPDYFKDILKENQNGTLNLSQEEADLLGITSGVGFYNLTPEQIIQTNAAEKEKLITKNELSRQLALQRLANLDTSNQLQKDLLYTDLEKAGTQTAADALNREAIRNVLAAEEKKFQDTVAGQTLTGAGSKKHRQTGKRYYAEETANLKDLLSRAGYNFTPTGATSSADIASGASGIRNIDADQLGFFGEAVSPYGNNTSLLNQAASGFLDLSTAGGTAALRGLGLDVTGAVSRALGGTVSSKYAKDIAKRIAREDLQRQVQGALQSSGFENRGIVGDTEQTKARKSALQNILNLQEKSRGK